MALDAEVEKQIPLGNAFSAVKKKKKAPKAKNKKTKKKGFMPEGGFGGPDLSALGGGADAGGGAELQEKAAKGRQLASKTQGRTTPPAGDQHEEVGLKVFNKIDSTASSSKPVNEDLTSLLTETDATEDDSVLSDDMLDEAAEAQEDFLDLQAEAKDAQRREIEAEKDWANDMEWGCLNGGMACKDASSEPGDPFDAPTSEAIGVRSSGSIDIPSILRAVEKRASSILEDLEKQRSAQFANRESARDEYRTARKANEKDFQDRMKALDKQSSADKRAVRSRKVVALLDAQKLYSKDWQHRQVRRAARSNMTAGRGNARMARLESKKMLRLERRSQQELTNKLFKDAMAVYKTFSRRLAKARFSKNALPRIRKMMAADVQGNLTLLDLAGGNEEALGAEVVNDPGFAGIKDVPSMKFYITAKARAKILPPLTKHFKHLRRDLWRALGKMRIATSTSLVSAVGAMPHVGGMFSAAIPGTVDSLFQVMKHAVNTSLGHVHENIAKKITEAIANPIMDVLTPKLQSNASLASVVLPRAKDLADMARQSKLLETRSVLANWGNGLEQARTEADKQLLALLQDAYDEVKLVLADVKSENDLKVEVLET